MFTEGYRKYKKMMFNGSSWETITDATGVARSFSPQYSYGGDIGNNLSYGYCQAAVCGGVHFGSGSTPATPADYDLENRIESGLKIERGGKVINHDELGKYDATGNFVVTNTSDEDITISEVGYYGYGGKDTSTTYYYLAERTVLDTPITISPGKTKLISYRFVVNYD